MHLLAATLAHPLLSLFWLVVGAVAAAIAIKIAKPQTIVGKIGSTIGKAAGQ